MTWNTSEELYSQLALLRVPGNILRFDNVYMHQRVFEQLSVNKSNFQTSSLNIIWASYQIRKIAGCACVGNAGNVFPTTAGQRSRHASRHVRRTCRDACQDSILAVSFEVGGGENVPGIPGACTIRNFIYLVKVPLSILLRLQCVE